MNVLRSGLSYLPCAYDVKYKSMAGGALVANIDDLQTLLPFPPHYHYALAGVLPLFWAEGPNSFIAMPKSFYDVCCAAGYGVIGACLSGEAARVLPKIGPYKLKGPTFADMWKTVQP